ncbi:hypothetical protein O181_010827 [Austropuccinia psidii MF-1]|uniref:Integrase catalytic domain-containing protein n=1 Tax=Austropuccinia psidii MF-1 TaxID=1389203 RepID=A0A9Q3BTF5_9BASI|nr:hypothetical protein [Austropuccinia psidii MF-1]
MTKTPFLASFSKAVQRLELIHMDLCGPIPPPSNSGSKYILMIIDGFPTSCRYSFFLLNPKTKEILKKYMLKIESQSNYKVANLISEKSTEFVNSELKTFFKEQYISNCTVETYTPENNPFSMWGNWTIITKAWCLLEDSGL